MEFISGALIAGTFLAAWLLGRPGPGRGASPQAPGPATAVRPAMAPGPATATGPAGPLHNQALERTLALAFRGSGDERLAALRLGLEAGARALLLPYLRRGRLDPDPRVAALAAEGLARFRGRPAAQPAGQPRTVARTR